MFIASSLILLAAALQVCAYHGCATGGPCHPDPQVLPFPDEDFQFEIRNLYTDRQRGARLNIFVKFRYYTPPNVSYYTTETGTFDYQDMVLQFAPADSMGIARNTFWEVVNRDMTSWAQFPIRGLSIRMEVQGMSSGGIAGHRSSTVTVGDIAPWVSIVNSFPGCDGMDTGLGNIACRLAPSWSDDSDPRAPSLAARAANKTGTHDKPRDCDECA